MAISSLQTADGLKLHTINWQPQGEPKAVILLVHGVAEHSGRYQHVADFFTQRGYAVYSYDHRGHGKSDGLKTYFESFDDPVEDMKRVFDTVQAQYPGKKIFIYGHSMGSLISTLYLLKYQAGVAGFISSGSPLGLDTATPKPLVWLGKLLNNIIPKVNFLPLDSKLVSRDPVEVEKYNNDPLVDRKPTRIGTGVRLYESAMKALPQLHKITVPLLILHGSADGICPPVGSQRLYDSAGSKDRQHNVYPGLYHEVHNEPEKLTVLTDAVTWLDAHL